MDPREAAKTAAARAAVERYVRPGLRLALGTGTTAEEVVRTIARLPGARSFDCVASSGRTEALARSLGLAVRPLRADDRFDLMLDGADEVAPELDLTKGGGGALLREKFLAGLSRNRVIVVDDGKLVRALGERSPVPIEVVPYCEAVLATQLREDGFAVRRRETAAGEPYLSENGLEILDLTPSAPLRAPAEVDRHLHARVGVVETGLFVGVADRVLVGSATGDVRELVRTARATTPRRPSR